MGDTLVPAGPQPGALPRLLTVLQVIIACGHTAGTGQRSGGQREGQSGKRECRSVGQSVSRLRSVGRSGMAVQMIRYPRRSVMVTGWRSGGERQCSDRNGMRCDTGQHARTRQRAGAEPLPPVRRVNKHCMPVPGMERCRYTQISVVSQPQADARNTESNTQERDCPANKATRKQGEATDSRRPC